MSFEHMPPMTNGRSTEKYDSPLLSARDSADGEEPRIVARADRYDDVEEDVVGSKYMKEKVRKRWQKEDENAADSETDTRSTTLAPSREGWQLLEAIERMNGQ
mmetsp:Transcript_19588/g.31749  ORF Transcript_19588/g.31749 Transcript_19588/m.31749 type:complete len:103 (-) Transcript_19588:58-366(-)